MNKNIDEIDDMLHDALKTFSIAFMNSAENGAIFLKCSMKNDNEVFDAICRDILSIKLNKDQNSNLLEEVVSALKYIRACALTSSRDYTYIENQINSMIRYKVITDYASGNTKFLEIFH
ncbi:MAG: hypothetical protein O3C05_02850 [Proteobacteria bacterium]|nr:hypothetical protein [Pseudomonadota bacterium]